MHQFWFKSEMFRVTLGEDEESNPFCYGRELAQWLQAQFAGRGYSPENAFPEDWGWCVMLSRTGGMLWLGCSNVRSSLYEQVTPEQKPTFVPEPASLVWTSFVGTDRPGWSLRFGQRRAAIEQLSSAAESANGVLESVLRCESRIVLVPQP